MEQLEYVLRGTKQEEAGARQPGLTNKRLPINWLKTQTQQGSGLHVVLVSLPVLGPANLLFRLTRNLTIRSISVGATYP